MTRSLNASLATEYTAQALMPIVLIELLFDSGALRFWSGVGDLVWNSNTYNGAGNLLKVSDYVETQNLQARGMVASLNGIPSEIIAIALTEPYQGRVAKIYVGALSDAGVLIGTPYQIFYGLMDNMQITEGGQSCDIALSMESRLVILKRKKERRYTPEDQKSRFAGDKGLDSVPTLQDREIVWKSK